MLKLPFDVSEFDPVHSEKIADWSPGDGSRVSFQESEHLYRTEMGNYFVLTDGGLYSRFTEFPGPEIWFGGIDIQPLTEDDAVAWCESTGNYDAIGEIQRTGG